MKTNNASSIASKREFQIYKKGTTVTGKVTILSIKGEDFNREEKIKKYLFLGYQVFDMNGNEIKSV